MYRDYPPCASKIICASKKVNFLLAGGGRLLYLPGRYFCSTTRLHLITAQVFVVKIFEPAAQILVRGFFRRGAGNF